MNSLQQLNECGQSYWLDNLNRWMIRHGTLEYWIREQGLQGITANPTTFREALAGQEYDDEISGLAQQGNTTKEIYDTLLVSDVQQACDLLQEVHTSTQGVDGFVSLEVSPRLAHDTEGTMSEARRYVALVNRPNLLIKVPATEAGIPAIEQLLYEGIPINITLLFSVQSYQAVIEAYFSALERRVTDGRPLQPIISVASFFVSRIDSLIDQLLRQRIPETDVKKQSPPARLLGRAAIANAKLAYQTFRQAFTGDRWKPLAARGARVQRPLWASTGTKSPSYSDVYYIEQLIGQDTVTTMPENTLRAFADHGHVIKGTIESDIDSASQIVNALEKVGVNFSGATWQLEHEGVQKFLESYNASLDVIDQKRKSMAGVSA